MRAALLTEEGPPEVIRLAYRPDPTAGDREATERQAQIGKVVVVIGG